jgi:hypothetical protein
VRENWFSGLTKHGGRLPERSLGVSTSYFSLFSLRSGMGDLAEEGEGYLPEEGADAD